MFVEKICEYLSEIGVLNIDNIDCFLKIHTNLPDRQFNNNSEKLQYTLFTYLKEQLKNDDFFFQFSKDIINSYANSQLITKYKTLRNFCALIQNKLNINYNIFFFKFSRYLISKNNFICFRPVYKNNTMEKKRCASDDDILRSIQKNSEIKKDFKSKKITKNKQKNNKSSKNNSKKIIYNTNNINNNNYGQVRTNYLNRNNFNKENENVTSYTYYSPAINIPSKVPISNNLKNIINNIDNNKIINNNFQNTQPIYNNNNSYFLNNSNYNNNNYNNNINMQTIPYSAPYTTNNNIINPNINNNFYIAADENNNNLNYYNFFDNEEKHVQKVQNKIMNLKMEKLNKLEEECTFNPKINPYYPSKLKPQTPIQNYNNNVKKNNINDYDISNNNNNNQTPYEKLYNDSNMNKIKRDERVRDYMNEFSFQPTITNNEKYKVKSSFEERRLKSIDMKKKYKKQKEEEELKIIELSKINNKSGNKLNEKEIVNRLYGKEVAKIKEKIKKEKKEKDIEEKKKHVIDWKKVKKEYNEKYPEGDDYKRHLEKRKQMFQRYNETRQKEEEKGKIKDFQDFLKNKEEGGENNDGVENVEALQQEKNENESKEIENANNDALKSNSLNQDENHVENQGGN